MFRRFFGRRTDEPGGTGESASRLSREEIERIGTERDPMRNYEAGLERNFAAMEAERRGDVARAVELYESSVADGFVQSHPYERLAAIYERRKAPDEAARVLTAFVRLAESQTLPRGAQRSANRKLPELKARLRRLGTATEGANQP